MPGPIVHRNEIERLERIAEWLDAKYTTPFGIRIGWDGILGFIPVLGGFVTTLLSAYLVMRAVRFGVSGSVLLRMGMNVIVDDLIGAVPFVGWCGDFAWKSNLKNTRLLRDSLVDPECSRRRSRWALAAFAGLALAGLTLSAVLIALVARAIFTAFYGLFAGI